MLMELHLTATVSVCVACHLTQVNAPRLNTSYIGWYSILIYLPQRFGRLS